MAKELKSHASVRTGTRVLSLEETSQNVVVELSDGSYITAGLVIGADGVRSCVREAIDRATTRNHGHLGRSDDCMLSLLFSLNLQ